MIEWLDQDRVAIGGRTFEIINQASAGRSSEATAIRKPEWFVHRYIELAATLLPKRVVELGIDQGGSTVFLTLLFSELEALLALDIATLPRGLLRFVAEHERGPLVRCEGGVDQSDRARLVELIDATFATAPLDLVIDDASHLLPETRVSFDVLFPRLRPDGVFVIEDWSWRHRVGRAIADREAAGEVELQSLPGVADQSLPPMPLSRLVLECMLVAAAVPGVIAEVRIRQGWAEILRGPDLLGEAFELSAQLGWIEERLLDGSFELD